VEATTLDRMAFPMYGSTFATIGSMTEWIKDKFNLVTEIMLGWKR
jgi:hypothetical protein